MRHVSRINWNDPEPMLLAQLRPSVYQLIEQTLTQRLLHSLSTLWYGTVLQWYCTTVTFRFQWGLTSWEFERCRTMMDWCAPPPKNDDGTASYETIFTKCWPGLLAIDWWNLFYFNARLTLSHTVFATQSMYSACTASLLYRVTPYSLEVLAKYNYF